MNNSISSGSYKKYRIISIICYIICFILFSNRILVDYTITAKEYVMLCYPNIVFYTSGAICSLVLATVSLTIYILSKKNKINNSRIPLMTVIALIIVSIVSITFARLSVNTYECFNDTAYEKYENLFPLDYKGATSDEKYFVQTTFSKTSFIDSYQTINFENDEIINSPDYEPGEEYLTITSKYINCENWRMKEFEIKEKLKDKYVGHVEDEIIYSDENITIHDGEVYYKLEYKSSNEYFYCKINRNKRNDMSADTFKDECMKILNEYRTIIKDKRT